jgi:hypothetical protein
MAPPTKIKMCFLLDCTYSMEPWIVAAKRQVAAIVNRTLDEYPNVVFNVAFVGYRDFGDTTPFVSVPFTSNIQSFLSQIDGIHSEGGGDIAEDVAGGLTHVADLNWGDADIRVLVHIADAPAHGNQFHGPNISDRFPQNDFGLLENVGRLIVAGIDYTFIRTNRDTDIMTNKFIHEYGHCPERTFVLLDLEGQEPPNTALLAEVDISHGERLFASEVTRTLSQAVSRHTSSQYPEAD